MPVKYVAYLKDRSQWAAILSCDDVTFTAGSVSTRNIPHCQTGVFLSAQNTGCLVSHKILYNGHQHSLQQQSVVNCYSLQQNNVMLSNKRLFHQQFSEIPPSKIVFSSTVQPYAVQEISNAIHHQLSTQLCEYPFTCQILTI